MHGKCGMWNKNSTTDPLIIKRGAVKAAPLNCSFQTLPSTLKLVHLICAEAQGAHFRMPKETDLIKHIDSFFSYLLMEDEGDRGAGLKYHRPRPSASV